MAPTSDQRRAFGEKLRGLRNELGQTTATLAAELGQRGFTVTAQAVGGWERGEYAPQSYALVAAIEATLGQPGELAPLLGLAEPDSFTARLDAIEAKQNAQEELLRQILELLPEAPHAASPRKRGRR